MVLESAHLLGLLTEVVKLILSKWSYLEVLLEVVVWHQMNSIFLT